MGKSDYIKGGIRPMKADEVEELNGNTATAPTPSSIEIGEEEKGGKVDAITKALDQAVKGKRKVKINFPAPTPETPLIPVIPKSQAASLFESVMNNPAFEFMGTQITPDYVENVEIPRLPISQVRSSLKSRFGGGLFKIQILHNGEAIREEQGGVLTINIPVTNIPDKKGPKVEDSDRVVELKKQEEEMKALARVEEAEERIERQREERERKKKAQNVDPIAQQLADLAKRLEDSEKQRQKDREEFERREREERDRRERDAKQPNFIEQAAALATALSPILAPILQRPEPPKQESARELLQMAIDAKRDEKKSEMGLVEKLLEKKLLEQPDQFKLYRELRREMSEEFAAMYGGANDESGKPPRDADEINPKYGWWNLAIVAKWVASAIEKAGPALPQYLAELSKLTGKTPAQLTALAQNPPAQQQTLPTPKNTAPVFQPASMPQAVTPDLMKPSAITAKPASRAVPIASAEMPTPAIAPVAETPLTTPTPLELPKIEIPKPLTDTEKDLFVQAEEVARIMRLDLETQRNEHQWVDAALALLHRDFLEKIAATNDQNERLRLIGEKVQPMQWAAISGMMVTSPEMPDVERDRNGTNYYNMLLALNALVEGFQNLKNEAAGKAVPAV